MKIASSNNHLKQTQNFKTPTTQVNLAIEKIIEFSFNHYLESIKLPNRATTYYKKISLPDNALLTNLVVS